VPGGNACVSQCVGLTICSRSGSLSEVSWILFGTRRRPSFPDSNPIRLTALAPLFHAVVGGDGRASCRSCAADNVIERAGGARLVGVESFTCDQHQIDSLLVKNAAASRARLNVLLRKESWTSDPKFTVMNRRRIAYRSVRRWRPRGQKSRLLALKRRAYPDPLRRLHQKTVRAPRWICSRVALCFGFG
jgi:hypothetical protein